MLVLRVPTSRRAASPSGRSTLAATIGREVSLALENAYLLQQARSRATNLETIFRISQAVSSSLQSTVVLNRVLDVVQKIFSAEAVSLMTLRHRQAHDRDGDGARHPRPGHAVLRDATRARTCPARCSTSGRARGLPRPGATRHAARAGSPRTPGSARCWRCRCSRAAAASGVLSVYSTEPTAFDAEDVELLQTFASQAALAIDTAKLVRPRAPGRVGAAGAASCPRSCR